MCYAWRRSVVPTSERRVVTPCLHVPMRGPTEGKGNEQDAHPCVRGRSARCAEEKVNVLTRHSIDCILEALLPTGILGNIFGLDALPYGVGNATEPPLGIIACCEDGAAYNGGPCLGSRYGRGGGWSVG